VLVPVVWVVGVVDCVVEGELAVVVLVSNSEHPGRARVAVSTTAIDRTKRTLLVDFTTDRYLL
jgi:hypothetical protein